MLDQEDTKWSVTHREYCPVHMDSVATSLCRFQTPGSAECKVQIKEHNK